MALNLIPQSWYLLQAELETLVPRRDLEKMKLYGKLTDFLKEVNEMPIVERQKVVKVTLSDYYCENSYVCDALFLKMQNLYLFISYKLT